MAINIYKATFGAKEGSHQLLESNLPMTTSVLEELRFLVDRPAGHIDLSASWSPYWGCQPVGEWWAVWRGEEDPTAPRKNMVRVNVALVSLADCGNISDISPILKTVGHNDESSSGAEFAGTAVERLAASKGPLTIPNLSIAPGLLSALWPKLWINARRELSLKTVFMAESINVATPPKIVLFPPMLLARWQGCEVTHKPERCSSPAGRWFAGEASPQLLRLFQENAERLPSDFSVLVRLNRLVEKLNALHSGSGTLADALLIVRTQEGFPEGLSLPSEDAEVVGTTLLNLANSQVDEIRAASLTRMDQIPNREAVQSAVARWVEKNITVINDQDALWLLQHHLGESHSVWWRSGVSAGLVAAFAGSNRQLAATVWRWLERCPHAIRWLSDYLDINPQSETWLAADAPDLPKGTLLDEIQHICSSKDWPILLATVLRRTQPLVDAIAVLKSSTAMPELGVDALIMERSASEIVLAAATTGWKPLIEQAANVTCAQPQFFSDVDNKRAVFELLHRHLEMGGQFPEVLISVDFLSRVFDGLLKSDGIATAIAAQLPARAGEFALVHKNAATVLGYMKNDVLENAAAAWWLLFTTDENTSTPPIPIYNLVFKNIEKQTKEKSIKLLIRALDVLPSIDEKYFTDLLRHTGFSWIDGDHQRLARILEARQWKSTVTMCRYSWKKELKLVAWHAASLLAWYDKFVLPPQGATTPTHTLTPTHTSNSMRITFLAANPQSSTPLALDQEARSIEEKIRAAKHREQVIFRTRWAVKPTDLQQCLLEDEPVVVHFSGHGGGASGIVLHAENQTNASFVEEDTLADLFRIFKDDIRVVVLNACYSEIQAQAIVKEIDFVVGMSDAIADDAARVFAAAFYRGLAFGRSVQSAFELGISELRLAGLKNGVDIPKLLVRAGMDASTTTLVDAGSP